MNKPSELLKRLREHMEKPTQKLIEPTKVEEPWTVIWLPNGDKIKMRNVVSGVFIQYDKDGIPIELHDGSGIAYGVNSQLVIFVEPKGETAKGMN
jgi:hypothetical protein